MDPTHLVSLVLLVRLVHLGDLQQQQRQQQVVKASACVCMYVSLRLGQQTPSGSKAQQGCCGPV
jgi:hypothetical protein